MAYIGPPPSQKLATPTSQYFSGNGSATAFTLNRSVNVSEDLNVFVNNVPQEPGSGKSYTATGTTLTFDAAPSSGTNNIYVVYRGLAEPTTRLEHPSGQPLAATTGAFSGNVTIGGNLSVTGTGAGAAGITSASTSGTAISIDSSNRVTQPSQPAFLARRNSTSSALAINTTHDMEFASEVFDVGSNFSSNTTFTAPVTGKYQLNWCVYLQGLDTATAYYQFIVITSNRDFYNIFTSSALGGDASYQSFVWGGLIDMDANDTAKVTLQIPNSGSAQATLYGGSADGATFFSGFLAC